MKLLPVLDGLGLAKWPSLILVTLVPAWFYANGWDAGFGAPREAVAIVQLDGASYRIWRSQPDAGTQIWCAQPVGADHATGQLHFIHGLREVPTRFESGLFCAELPAESPVPQLRLR